MIFLTFFDSTGKKEYIFRCQYYFYASYIYYAQRRLIMYPSKTFMQKKKKNLFKDFQKNSILEIQRSPLIAPFNRATIATAPPIFTEHFLRAASSSRHAFLRVRGTPCHEFPAFEYKT